MSLPDPDQALRKAKEIATAFVDRRPINPADLVVLRIGVVVAALRPADLVPSKHHRRPLGKKQRREEVPLLTLADGDDRGIVGRAFDAMVEGTVVRLTIAVLLAVHFVVL